LLPEFCGEAPRIIQVIEHDALSGVESLQGRVCLLLNFADVRRPNAKLPGECALRARRAVKARLPDQQLDDPTLPVGAQA
jgi:hypothetical protein